MSPAYHPVHWNRQKKLFDGVLVLGISLTFSAYVAISLATNPNITAETLIIRGTSLSAFLLLHVILCIGPLSRFDSRFLPLLYNRRHLGVAMFLLAMIHGVFSAVQFHGFGNKNPFVSIFTAYQSEYTSSYAISNFPFEPFGALALTILFVMAATSHDFWLHNLGSSLWKALHVLVYVAYGAIVVHVAYGLMQSERSVVLPILLATSLCIVLGLHIATFFKERSFDKARLEGEVDDFQHACSIGDLAEGQGYLSSVRFDRIALYRVNDHIYALNNACRHQAGPIGEGRLVNGLVTCPWHGWNYHPEDGVSPPPFEAECIPTYRVRVLDGDVYVHPDSFPLRTKTSGAPVAGGESTPLHVARGQ